MEKVFKEASSNSPDEDWPASDTKVKKFKSNKVVVFNSKRSMAIQVLILTDLIVTSKHWFEFNESDINTSIKNAIGLISDYSKDNEVFFVKRIW